MGRPTMTMLWKMVENAKWSCIVGVRPTGSHSILARKACMCCRAAIPQVTRSRS